MKGVVLVGIGEMGGVFGRAFLKAGHPVYPVTRETMGAVKRGAQAPEAVVIAVGEKDLQDVLATVPGEWKDRLVLLQNELLPKDWKRYGLSPTVISVWFEKKPGQDVKVIIPSPVFGPKAELVSEALGAIGIPCNVLRNEDELLFELILKNLYILTVNIAGLKVGGTVGELWNDHQDLARAVAADVLDLQFHLAGKEFTREELIKGMVAAFEGDMDHKCMGRSAPARLERALAQAKEAGLDVPALKEIAASHTS